MELSEFYVVYNYLEIYLLRAPIIGLCLNHPKVFNSIKPTLWTHLCSWRALAIQTKQDIKQNFGVNTNAIYTRYHCKLQTIFFQNLIWKNDHNIRILDWSRSLISVVNDIIDFVN